MGTVELIDRAKLKLLLQEHHRDAYGWALFCSGGDREEAEDLLQSVYLELLGKKSSFQGRSQFRTWLFAVIRNCAAKRRSRLGRRLEQLKGWLFETSEREAQTEKVYRSELRQAVESMLASLSKRQREVIVLVFYHELTLDQAAKIMGVSIGSARTHYERGKARLRLEMEKTGLCDERRIKNQAVI